MHTHTHTHAHTDAQRHRYRDIDSHSQTQATHTQIHQLTPAPFCVLNKGQEKRHLKGLLVDSTLFFETLGGEKGLRKYYFFVAVDTAGKTGMVKICVWRHVPRDAARVFVGTGLSSGGSQCEQHLLGARLGCLHCLPASCPGAGGMLCTQRCGCRWLRPSLHPGSSFLGTGHMEMRGLAKRDREAAILHCGQTCGESAQPGSGTSPHSSGGTLVISRLPRGPRRPLQSPVSFRSSFISAHLQYSAPLKPSNEWCGVKPEA